MVLLYGMRQVDQEDELNIQYMRIYFATCMSITLLVWLYVRSKVLSTPNDTVLSVSEADLKPANPLGDALGVKSEDTEKKPMSVTEYDLSKVKEKLNQIAMQTVIVTGIHYQWQVAMPLVISSTMAVIGLMDDQLIKLYILGTTEEQDETLKRPFKAPKSPFADLMASAAPEDTEKLDDPSAIESKKDK